MEFEIVTIPCLADNYAFLVNGGGRTALIDAPETAPIAKMLGDRGWTLDEVWLTHHHADHVDGLPDLRDRFDPLVRGARADAHRLPDLDAAHDDGDSFDFAGAEVSVIDVSGHTINHIAFLMPAAHAAFTGDSLMAMGCGRVFEGTMEQMWRSLTRFMDLPPHTLICSGHEYTANNAKFAATIEPDNTELRARMDRIEEARAEGRFTVPSQLGEELATNPFLRAGLDSVKSSLDMSGASDADVFAEIRRRKDAF